MDLAGRRYAFSYNGKRSCILTAVISALVLALLILSYNRAHILSPHSFDNTSNEQKPEGFQQPKGQQDVESDHNAWVPEGSKAHSKAGSDSKSALAEDTHAPWLLAISTTFSHVQRRMFIRNTYINLYHGSGHFDYMFAISKPPAQWTQMIEQENKTFGDIFIVDTLEDNEWTAKHTKPIELLRLLSQGRWKGRSWDFVSKTDEDSWVYPTGFFQDYLRPLIERKDTHSINRTMMGMPLVYCAKGLSPAGGFETFSWDLVQLLPELRERHPTTLDDVYEDCQPAKYLEHAGIEYNFVSLEGERAFDVVKETFHGHLFDKDYGPIEELTGAIYIHRLKSDDEWLRAAALFDENGFVTKSKNGTSDKGSSEPPRPRRKH